MWLWFHGYEEEEGVLALDDRLEEIIHGKSLSRERKEERRFLEEEKTGKKRELSDL